MLFLKKEEDDKIYIGDDVVVTIIAIRGDKVRIGFNAPGVYVFREELYNEIVARKGDFGERKFGDKMLILSRIPEERFVLILQDNRKIIVEVVKIRGYRVKLGLEVPSGLSVVCPDVVAANEDDDKPSAVVSG